MGERERMDLRGEMENLRRHVIGVERAAARILALAGAGAVRVKTSGERVDIGNDELRMTN